jgi:hypothetical protein
MDRYSDPKYIKAVFIYDGRAAVEFCPSLCNRQSLRNLLQRPMIAAIDSPTICGYLQQQYPNVMAGPQLFVHTFMHMGAAAGVKYETASMTDDVVIGFTRMYPDIWQLLAIDLGSNRLTAVNAILARARADYLEETK